MTSLVPSLAYKAFLEATTAIYQQALRTPECANVVAYLRDVRGLSGVNAQYFRLGAATPVPGHEDYRGMLSIPYLTRSGVVSMRFRRIDGGKPKYRSLPGDPPRLFHPAGLCRPEPYVCICEGEMDTMTAHQAGLPAVGVPGAATWRPWMARTFVGYRDVYVLADNDDSGEGAALAAKIAEQVRGTRIVLMPRGDDVNRFACREGHAALLERIGIDE